MKGFLDETAKTKPVPFDWIYVNNFRNSYEPKAIKLPPGKGIVLQKDLKTFIEDAKKGLPKAFDSEDYAAKKDATIGTIEAKRRKLFTQLRKRAHEEGFLLQNTPMGLLSIPLKEGKPMTEKEIITLSPQMREEIQKRRDKLNAELRSAIRQLRDLGKQVTEAIEKLEQEVALYTIGHLISDLTEKYKAFPDVATYIGEVRDDILANLGQFIGKPKDSPQFPFPVPWMKELPFRKFAVNVIVDNSDLQGSPVVIELNPTYQRLFGRIEKEAQFGVLTTDFTMIRGGSLHKANGGYLVIPTEELLRNLFSYDSLKRALKNDCITIEEAGERLGFIVTKGLRPSPIPLNIKVILIGGPILYRQLYALDTDFKELFKVKGDFDITMDRNKENVEKYATFICTCCLKENLRQFDASGVGKKVEYGSRLAADQEKLSTRFAEIADIIREANFYAGQEGSNNVNGSHVKKAIEEKFYRSNLIQAKIREMIERGFLLIETKGEALGQVNGLSVLSLGDFSFGLPSRVTASIGLGRE